MSTDSINDLGPIHRAVFDEIIRTRISGCWVFLPIHWLLDLFEATRFHGMLVTEYEWLAGEPDEDFSRPLNAWTLKKENVTRAALESETVWPGKFSKGSFAISADRQRVRLGILYAPLAGSGEEYDVIVADGKLRLIPNGQYCWVS